MTSKNKQYIEKMPKLILIYGIFSVLCHMAMVFLYSKYICTVETLIFEKTLFELLEYSLMSLLLVLLGSLLWAFVIKKRES